jgi:hypothetical protein
MKSGPKPKTLPERISIFNAWNNDRKCRIDGDRVRVTHKDCGTSWLVDEVPTRRQSVVDYASQRPNMSLSSRYRCFGCPKCEVSEEKSLQSRRETNRKKYGHDSPTQSESVKKRIQLTNRKRYGVASPLSSPELRDKGYRRMEETFGLPRGSVQNTMDVPELSRSSKLWMQDPLRISDALSKTRVTCLKKYGVSSARKADSVKRKIRKTMLRRHGVSSPAHMSSAAFRTLRRKEGTDSMGNPISVQGHEQQAIDFLVSSASCEWVTTSSRYIPYTDDSSSRRYYPDLEALGKSGTQYVLEVKCAYTLKSNWDLNLKKFRAARRFCKRNGLEFSVLLFDNKGSTVDVVHRPTAKRLERSLRALL